MARIAIMKADARTERLTELLRLDGVEAALFSETETTQAAAYGDVIVLPLTAMGTEMFNGLLDREQHLVSGQDFLQRDDFSVLNAIPTVEGAIQVAINNTTRTIHASRCCVIGFGRIGKLLAERLCAFGAYVSVAARKAGDIAWIRARGYTAINSMRLEARLCDEDIIFNTVPHMMLTYARLTELKKGCLLVDLASAPGGIDFKAAERLGINAKWALSLPGKVAPESAAGYLRDTLMTILREREIMI
ncbi:MAG: hypothetical protein LBR85_06870 [Oscillospiraceae bacterium]|nr:hypothetical protein [Oscillospiraceae bacterium]